MYKLNTRKIDNQVNGHSPGWLSCKFLRKESLRAISPRIHERKEHFTVLKKFLRLSVFEVEPTGSGRLRTARKATCTLLYN